LGQLRRQYKPPTETVRTNILGCKCSSGANNFKATCSSVSSPSTCRPTS
jgi:hypothetical protein